MTLRSKTFLPLTVLSALFFLFLYGYWFPQSLRNMEREELRATTRHLNSVAEGLVPLLLAHQLDTVYENLDALLSQNREWAGIRLINPDGTLLYPLQEPPAASTAPSREHVRVVEHRIQFLGNDLGRLILMIDISAMTAAAEMRHRQLVTALLIVFCGYLLSIGIIVERIVRRPVNLLAHAVEKVALGEFNAPLIKTGNDEIGMLVDSFAGMRDAILESQEDLAERVMLAELSADIGYALTTQGELASMLDACTQALVRHLGVAFARIWTLNTVDNCLELHASAGLYTRIDGNHSRVPVGMFKIGMIAAERKPHVTNAVIGDPRVHDQEWAAREGMVAFAGHPLTIEDKLVGVMAMFSRKTLSDVRIKSLAAVSNEIAIGIERKRAEEALFRLNEELEQRVQERTTALLAKTDELGQKNLELERFNKLFVNRELRMVELKARIRELEKRISG